ncbi:MAG TPA: hypothetical protein VN520_28900 [Streptomyces sp.]|nr:hypothetical protein [Streptomyces sp.]HWU10341.1 hypothetical protein [Streptomyces sp.]
MYGRVSGGLPYGNPYRRAHRPEQVAREERRPRVPMPEVEKGKRL